MSATRLIVGSAIHELQALPAGSVDLVVTSSPFLGVRDYLPADHPMKAYELGVGGSPASFVSDLLDVAEACAHALAPHGTLVWELGDSMAGSGGAGGDYYNADGQRAGQPKPPGGAALERAMTKGRARSGHDVPAHAMRPAVAAKATAGSHGRVDEHTNRRPGVPPQRAYGPCWPTAKSHTMVPEMFRMAMAYGLQPYTDRACTQWIVRNVVRWCKPNPSVGDEGDKYRRATTDLVVAALQADRYWDPVGARGPARTNATDTAPLYDWWEVSTGNYSGAHFATWPVEIVNPFVASLCPPRVCTTCGEPARRIVRTSDDYADARAPGDMFATLTGENDRGSGRNGAKGGLVATELEPLGWTWCGHGGVAHQLDLASKADWRAAGKPRWPMVRIGATFAGYLAPGCTVTSGDHQGAGRRGVVLDPFAGSGTTLAAASGAGRDAIGIELLDDHAELARQRLGMFVSIEHGTAHLADEAAS